MRQAAYLATLLGAVLQVGCGGSGTPDPGAELQQVEQRTVVTKGIIILDRTGSMSVPRTGSTKSRCHDARAQALIKADEFFTKHKGSALAVWTVDSSVQKLTTGYVNLATATSAINALTPEGCLGSTPLADGVCTAIDALLAEPKVPGATNLITILSDGGENASLGGCAGNTNDQFDTGSWRFKARQKVVAAQPWVQINAQYWTGSLDIQLTGDGAGPRGPEPVPDVRAGTSPGQVSAMGTCSSQDKCDHDVFLALAQDSGGIYELVKDNSSQYPCAGAACPAPYYEPIEW